MLNEAVEAEVGDITSIKVPLGTKNVFALNLVFGQKGKKRQLIKESISFGENEIDNPPALSYFKVYLRRFFQNKLNPLHTSEIFEQCEITEVDKKGIKRLKRTLLVKGTDPKIFLDEVEAEAMIDTMRDAMQGYNRAKLFEQFIAARVNGMSTQIFHLEGDELVMENFVYNPMSQKAQKLIQHIESNPFSEDEIRAILKEKDKK